METKQNQNKQTDLTNLAEEASIIMWSRRDTLPTTKVINTSVVSLANMLPSGAT